MITTESLCARYAVREYTASLLRFNEAVFAYDLHEQARVSLEDLLRGNSQKIEGIGADIKEAIDKEIADERDRAEYVRGELAAAAKKFVDAADRLEEFTGITPDAAAYMRAFDISRANA